MASIISMSVIAALGYYIAKRTSTRQSFEKLTSIRNSKAQEISDYFHRLQDLSILISLAKTTSDAFEEFDAAYSEIKNNKTIDSSKISEMRLFRDDFYYRNYYDTAGIMAIDREKFLSYLPKNKEAILLQAACHNTEFAKLKLFENYQKALLKYDKGISDFVHYSDLGGLLLINSETGDIVYTVNKLSELGGNIILDSLGTTNLAKSFMEIRFAGENEIRLIRFQSYFPAYLLPKAFIICPVFINNRNVAVVALRISIDQLNSILNFNRKWEENGMGKTGEVYMVGSNNMLRTESRFYLENPDAFIAKMENLGYPDADIKEIRKTRSTLLNIRISTDAVQAANKGETGISILSDYRMKEVLCAFMPLDIIGLRYAMIAQIDTEEAFGSIAVLKKFMIYSYAAVLLSMIIIAFLLSGLVTRPINKLTESARELSNGNFQTLVSIKSNDEIGILAESFHLMQTRIVDLIGNLKSVNSTLEEKQKDIYDSIRYARNIQNNILASHNLLKENLPDHFIFFSPRDVVSGDFYWAINVPSKTSKGPDSDYSFNTRQGESFFFAVCDSTGHGIPGAFMSLLNVSFLNEAIVIQDIELPSDILNYVRESLINALSIEKSRDGMDGVLIYIDPNEDHLHYAGAFNSPLLVRDNTLKRCDIDKMPIGKGLSLSDFSDHQLKIRKGDILYLYTDGFPDQFGGQHYKKYKYSRFREFILSISSRPLIEQKQMLIDEFEKWKGDNEQTDDVLVVGIRF